MLTGPRTEEPVEEEGEDAEPQARHLSRSERRVLERLLNRLLVPITTALGVEHAVGKLAQGPEELVTLEDAGPGGDPRRLMLHFMVEAQTGTSDLRIYLHGKNLPEHHRHGRKGGRRNGGDRFGGVGRA